MVIDGGDGGFVRDNERFGEVRKYLVVLWSFGGLGFVDLGGDGGVERKWDLGK